MYNYIRLKEIGSKDIPDFILITWHLQSLDSEYDSFHMMLNKSYMAKQAKEIKPEPEFDFILKQILNLDTQCKSSETRFMNSCLQPKDRNKDPGDLYLYCSRPGQT